MNKVTSKNILKEAGVLLIVALMTLSTTTVIANTFGVQSHESVLRTPLDTLLFENFDGTWVGSPPAPMGWTQYCTNPGAEIWQPNTVRYVSPPNSAYRGGFGSTLLSDDWLVSPEINAAGYSNINLSWWERHGWLNYYSNYCGLWISCGSPDPADQDYVLIMERPPPDDTVGIWISYCVILDTYLTDDTFYIAWEYDKTSTGMTSCWNIDDVEVTAEYIEPLVADADGPYEAEEDEPIQFQGSATGGDPPYSYEWDFGNGDTSDEQNPVYAYDDAGVYDVTLTVTDNAAATDDDETTATITEKQCCFEVTPKKLNFFKFKADVTEICGINHSGVNWTISITGGVFFPASATWNGVISSIPANGVVTINTGFMIGLGSITIIITIDDCDPEVFDGKILLFLIIV